MNTSNLYNCDYEKRVTLESQSAKAPHQYQRRGESTCSEWKRPVGGVDIGLVLYNSLTSRKVPFVPQHGRSVTMYTCGPTVYASSHVGHARNYVAQDVFVRVLEYLGYQVTLAMNVTDVDDKIISRADEEGVEYGAFGKCWESDFFSDMDQLNVRRPHIITRVSEYIEECVEYVKKIVNNDYGYIVNGSVYFDTRAFSKNHFYGKLRPSVFIPNEDAIGGSSGNSGTDSTDNPKCGKSKYFGSYMSGDTHGEDNKLGRGEKRTKEDFVLWKANKKASEPSWPSPWGPGRPGWHIECSAMASSVFGEMVDIHGGGIDLRFPHHDNEIAQAEAYFDSDSWVQYFLHVGHLHVNGLKMSKSLKNFVTIKEVLGECHWRLVRLMFLMHAWGENMDFSTENMINATNIENTFTNFFNNVACIYNQRSKEPSPEKWGKAESALYDVFVKARADVHLALLDNINTVGVIRVLQNLVNVSNVYMKEHALGVPILLERIAEYITGVFNVFGLIKCREWGWEHENAPPELQNSSEEALIRTIVEFRMKVRRCAISGDTKDILKLSDGLRDDVLPNIGVYVEDSKFGSVVRIRSNVLTVPSE